MSIIDVAKVAGVSKSTVSRVINNAPGVKPRIAKAVQDAMEQIGYEPSIRRPGPKPAARRGIRTGNVLLLVLGFKPAEFYRMPVFPSLLQGVETGCREAGLNLVLATVEPGGVLPAALLGGDADGVLILGTYSTLSEAARLRLEGLPCVALMREFDDLGLRFDRVLYDNAAVGMLAARYLLGRGHRRLGFLNTSPEHDAFARRHRDFTAAATAAGAEVVSFLSDRRPTDLRGEIAEYDALVGRMLDEKERVTGLFVPTVIQLPQVYQALEARKIRPGTDLDLIGCDYEAESLSQLTPRPATIDINLGLVGSRGVQQLLWRAANPDENNRLTVLVEPALIEPHVSVHT